MLHHSFTAALLYPGPEKNIHRLVSGQTSHLYVKIGKEQKTALLAPIVISSWLRM